MSRPRRFTAQQALQLIQQLDENDSGESGDDDGRVSALETGCLSSMNTSSSSSDNESVGRERQSVGAAYAIGNIYVHW